ncbi:MAG: phage tail sheath subtilisin-like domain-containing protein [Myxococcota bacterium]
MLHPGVYVQEVPSGVRAIEGVATSVTIFVGETERGPPTPQFITGRTSYERLYGGYLRPDSSGTPVRCTMTYAIDLFFQNGGTRSIILRAIEDGSVTATRGAGADTVFTASSPGAWGNNITAILMVSSDGVSAHFRVAVFYQTPGATDFTLVENWDGLSPVEGDDNYAGDVLKRSAYIRFGNPATMPSADFILGSTAGGASGAMSPAEMTQNDITTVATGASFGGANGTDGTNGEGSYAGSMPDLLARLDGVDDAALIVNAMDLWTQSPNQTDAEASYGAFRTYVDNRPKRDLFYIADVISRETDSADDAVSNTVSRVRNNMTTTDMAGLYYPHVIVRDPVGATRNATLTVPPSGLVAGLYGRTDSRRGVWKAPAGTEATIGGIVGLTHAFLDTHQDLLNPIGINALRTIPGAGTVIWGARTLRPSSEWRYVPVRRTAMFLRKSIFNGIQWAVFEPNDEDLWQSLRASVGSFMETQFRNGAFAGATSKEAYFVLCDASTTDEIDQTNGVVNLLVGFAPLRPAEFVVVKLSQKTNISF